MSTFSKAEQSRTIELRGVRTHNLKGIDLDLPLGRLIVGHRRKRRRQEFAGLRHTLRRGPAPVRRDLLAIHQAVPRKARQARRRPDRAASRRRSRLASLMAATPAAARSARSPRSTTHLRRFTHARARSSAVTAALRSSLPHRRHCLEPSRRCPTAHATKSRFPLDVRPQTDTAALVRSLMAEGFTRASRQWAARGLLDRPSPRTTRR